MALSTQSRGTLWLLCMSKGSAYLLPAAITGNGQCCRGAKPFLKCSSASLAVPMAKTIDVGELSSPFDGWEPLKRARRASSDPCTTPMHHQGLCRRGAYSLQMRNTLGTFYGEQLALYVLAKGDSLLRSIIIGPDGRNEGRRDVRNFMYCRSSLQIWSSVLRALMME